MHLIHQGRGIPAPRTFKSFLATSMRSISPKAAARQKLLQIHQQMLVECVSTH